MGTLKTETLIKRRSNAIFAGTVKAMENLGTYRFEFSQIIRRYSDLRVHFDFLCEEWANGGYVITEDYTNKSGATNERVTPLYTTIEKTRAELTELETLLGLTPKGLQAMKKKGLEGKRKSALDKLLE